MKYKQIIFWSGGQTVVDRAALNFSIDQHYRYGGFCTAGRKAEDGIIPPFYKLTEISDSKYKERTKMNVLHSDGTLTYI